MQALECKIDDKPSKEEVSAMIQKEMKRSEPNIKQTAEVKIKEVAQQAVRDQTLEMQRAEERKGGLVIFKLSEKNDKGETDVSTFMKICDHLKDRECNIQEKDILKTVRLGRKRDNPNDPRPLLINLREPEMKRPIFRNLYKLKNTEFEKIKFKHDETPAQREELKRMNQEVMANNDSSKNFKYRIRGPPWNRRIVTVKINTDLENGEEK